jgi:glyoxylase-like metal-dependent hydrolase (beta-lactamase superfamily II)
MTARSLSLCLFAWGSAGLLAQQPPVPQAVLSEDTVRISDHVWAIMGWPNIAIIVGEKATLVVDTGLGPRNGATIARVARRLAPNNQKLYLTTTHYHPEHAAGESGFPPGTILIRNAAQQQDMDRDGARMLQRFAGIAPLWKELLADARLRTPDITFDNEAKIDLGGVTARLLWFGGAHTTGDELTFAEPDRTLVSGDVVQNKFFPLINSNGGTPGSWLAVLDKISALDVLHVLPDHSAPGDGSLVAAEKKFIGELRSRAMELKKSGVSSDDAGRTLGPEFKSKYPDYLNLNDTNVTGFVKRVYDE